MTPPSALAPDDRRLVALAATLAPDVAARILGRLAGGEAAVAWGRTLATLSRSERLAALAGALSSFVEPIGPAAGQAVLDAERPAVARALRRLVLGRAPWPAGLHPLLARAARECLARKLPPTDPPSRARCCPSTCRV